MIEVIVPGLSTAALLLGLQSVPGVEGIMTTARVESDSTDLVALVRNQPDDAREGLSRLLEAVSGALSADAAAQDLRAAERLAGAYADAWNDPFPIDQVRRFRDRGFSERAIQIQVDSLRRAGNEAFRREGIDEALALWRLSRHKASLIDDSVGIARALGNIGAAYRSAGEPDSAVAYLEMASAAAAAAGDQRTTAFASINLANVYADAHDFRRATELYEVAIASHERTGNFRGLASAEHNLALILLGFGDFDGASRRLIRAREVNLRHGFVAEAADDLLSLADADLERGEYTAALGRLAQAEAEFGILDDQSGLTAVLHRKGIAALRRADFVFAIEFLGRASDGYRGLGLVLHEIASRRELSSAFAAVGDLDQALVQLVSAETLAGDSHLLMHTSAELALIRADLALRFNELSDAQIHYGRARWQFMSVGDVGGRAEAELGLTILEIIRGNDRQAIRSLETTLVLHEAVGNEHAAAYARLLTGIALERIGDVDGARIALAEATDGYRASDYAPGIALGHALRGDLESRSGQPAAAEWHHRKGLDVLGDRTAPHVSWRLHAGLAEALSAQGEFDAAAGELRAAVETLEAVSGSVALDERRLGFLFDKDPVYAQLAEAEVRRGDFASAFSASERGRARWLLATLSRGRLTPVAPAERTLALREQDARARVNQLSSRMWEADPAQGPLRDPMDDAVHQQTVRDLQAAEAEHARIVEDLRENMPDYARLVDPPTPTWREAGAALAQDEALLEYMIGGSTTLVFVITSDTLTVLDLAIDGESLRALIDFARGAITGASQRHDGNTWGAPLKRLHDLLVAPVEENGWLDGKSRLRIVPHGELHYVPFQALLHRGEPTEHLIERFTVSYAPSVTAWLQLRERRWKGGSSRVLALAPKINSLPAAEDEVRRVGERYGDESLVMIGESATKEVLLREAPGARIIHIASVGRLNRRNPLFSYVELGAEDDGDGRLEVHEVFSMDLSSFLVVLSACETGLGSGMRSDVPAGDDWVGLVRAFQHAGAANVLAALWRVDDGSTAELMRRFYDELDDGMTPEDALATAQRSMIKSGAGTNPFHWAAFVLNGSS